MRERFDESVDWFLAGCVSIEDSLQLTHTTTVPDLQGVRPEGWTHPGVWHVAGTNTLQRRQRWYLISENVV
jgi:hypothetical protein